MAEYIQGINPTIIKWARERSGYSLQEVAKSLNRDVATISDWESGAAAPTYVQLETLTDKYKRPIAMFFFPEAAPRDLILRDNLPCEVPRLSN